MKTNKKILVVDDAEINVEVLLELLSEEYDVMAALDGEMALEIASEDEPDLILLDIMMPKMDGFEVCRKLKVNSTTKDIPIIFITAKVDEDAIEKAYDLGGTDYVTKPFKPKELLARVKKELKLQELIYNLQASKEELIILASTDSMTKLYNRRYFSTTSVHIINLAKRDKTDTSVIMIDIDKFKAINDTYGHQVGDDVIILLAQKLQDYARHSDIVCRYGGEEFVLLLPETSIEGALVIAEKIRLHVENMSVEAGEHQLKFTVSIGISQINIKDDINIESALHRADTALYEAKTSGRNRVCIESNKNGN